MVTDHPGPLSADEAVTARLSSSKDSSDYIQFVLRFQVTLTLVC